MKAARRDGRLRLEATIWRSNPAPPVGRQFVTLEDAGNYITKLPKAEHDAPERQAAMEALILAATSGGPTMFRFNVRAGIAVHLIPVQDAANPGAACRSCRRESSAAFE